MKTRVCLKYFANDCRYSWELFQKLLYYFITANSTWKFNHPQFLGTNDTSIKLLSRLILMKTFQNCPNKLHYISGFEHMAFTLFSCSFLYFQITAEISIIKKCTKRDLYFTCNALLKYFNSLVLNRFLHNIWNVVTYSEKLRNYSGI